MLRLYFGHHKCASTWIWQIMSEVFRRSGHSHRLVLDLLTPTARGELTDYNNDFSREELGQYLHSLKIDFASCITADVEHLQSLGIFRGVHVIRDPRDIIVSAYFSHRNSHPTGGLAHLEQHRERLRSVSKEEGLLEEMQFSAHELDTLSAWDYSRPDILELKMEEITNDSYRSFIDIFRFLGLIADKERNSARGEIHSFASQMRNRVAARSPRLTRLSRKIPPTGKMILGCVYANRFEVRARGRTQGDENEHSHYRKGVHGDWINHFTPHAVEVFKERFGEILVKLGYEDDQDWGLGFSRD